MMNGGGKEVDAESRLISLSEGDYPKIDMKLTRCIK